jgi:hypothetical protein
MIMFLVIYKKRGSYDPLNNKFILISLDYCMDGRQHHGMYSVDVLVREFENTTYDILL